VNVEDFKKLVKQYSEEDITTDEPHVSLRCEQNDITIDVIKKTLLDPNANLVRIIEDRPKVYKVYYPLSKKRELKVVVDVLTHKKLNIRTVRILDKKSRLAFLSRRRF
jgi:hypothetical protein